MRLVATTTAPDADEAAALVESMIRQLYRPTLPAGTPAPVSVRLDPQVGNEWTAHITLDRETISPHLR